MSFTITQQPSNTVPQPKSKYLEWLLGTTSFLNSADAYATFTVTFVDGAEADALIVQVLGNSFTTESAQPFTLDSYHHEAVKEDTAANFVGMLSIAPAFLDWIITYSGGVVTATNSKPGVVSPFTFNFTALVVEPTVGSTNGTTESRKSKFVIWDLYAGTDRIVGRKSAAIDPSGVNGVCSIKFDPLSCSTPTNQKPMYCFGQRINFTWTFFSGPRSSIKIVSANKMWKRLYKVTFLRWSILSFNPPTNWDLRPIQVTQVTMVQVIPL